MEINLQKFADGEEVELEEDDEIKEEIEEESKEEVEEETEEEVKEEEPKKSVDKVTAAVIREKQENKKLRDRLATLEKDKADREQAEQDKKTRQRFIDDGLTEEEADSKISDRKEREELKRDLREIKYGQQADKLALKYPSIYEHLDNFIPLVEASKGGLTLAELCKAKLDEATTAEIKTKTEQELLLNKQKAKDKQIKTGDVKTDTPVKLSVDDERVLSNINKKRQVKGQPLMTRKQFLEFSN